MQSKIVKYERLMGCLIMIIIIKLKFNIISSYIKIDFIKYLKLSCEEFRNKMFIIFIN